MFTRSHEEVDLDPPSALWQVLRDLALCAVIVGACALIVGFLTATSAHAQGRGQLCMGDNDPATLRAEAPVR